MRSVPVIIYFRSMGLEASSLLPPRRRPGWFLLALSAGVTAIVVTSVLESTGSFADAMLGGVLTLLLIAALYIPLNLSTFGRARARLRALESTTSARGEAIPIRSTVVPTGFPSEPRSLVEDYVSPWLGYNLLVLGERGFEIRWPRTAGSPAGVLIHYSSVHSVEVRLASFGNFRERAIFISGVQGRHSFRVGFAPVDSSALLLTPVNDQAFNAILGEAAARTTGDSDRRTSLRGAS